MCVCVCVCVCVSVWSRLRYMCSSVSDPHVCFSSGGADRQQCVRLHPPSRPRRDGRAAGNQATPEGRGRLPHNPRERFQLRLHLLPGWHPWTRYCQIIERELREIIYKEMIFVKFFYSCRQQLPPVLILLLMSLPTAASSSAWSPRSPKEACTSSLQDTRYDHSS